MIKPLLTLEQRQTTRFDANTVAMLVTTLTMVRDYLRHNSGNSETFKHDLNWIDTVIRHAERGIPRD